MDQGMVDIYGNPPGNMSGRRVYGGIVPRQRGDSVSTTMTNGNGHGGNGYGGGVYNGHEESVPSSPIGMTSGMMQPFYNYGGGGEVYYPQGLGNNHRGRGKSVSTSSSSLALQMEDANASIGEVERTASPTETTTTLTFLWDPSDHRPHPTSTIPNTQVIPMRIK